MPLHGCLTPDGYKNTQQAWLNPEAISRRTSFAVALASGKLPLNRPQNQMGDDATVDPSWRSEPINWSDLTATLGQLISPTTMEAVTQSEPALRSAMLLGSPDFMRR